jgi:hypothetical protein
MSLLPFGAGSCWGKGWIMGWLRLRRRFRFRGRSRQEWELALTTALFMFAVFGALVVGADALFFDHVDWSMLWDVAAGAIGIGLTGFEEDRPGS